MLAHAQWTSKKRASIFNINFLVRNLQYSQINSSIYNITHYVWVLLSMSFGFAYLQYTLIASITTSIIHFKTLLQLAKGIFATLLSSAEYDIRPGGATSRVRLLHTVRMSLFISLSFISCQDTWRDIFIFFINMKVFVFFACSSTHYMQDGFGDYQDWLLLKCCHDHLVLIKKQNTSLSFLPGSSSTEVSYRFFVDTDI